MWRFMATLALALAPAVAAAQTTRPSVQSESPPYAVKLPPSPRSSPQGWGLYVIAKGRSLDLSQRGSGWSDDPAAPRTDLEAGYGWWSGPATTIVGYIQHDNRADQPWIEPHSPSDHRSGGSGVLGLGFVVHTR